MSIGTGDILTSASILVALAVFSLGYAERRSSDRRKRTLDFLLALIADDGELSRCNLQFAVWLAEGRGYVDDDIRPDERRVLVKLLDYYDLIADTAAKSVIDKELVIVHLGGRMRSTHQALGDYIAARRRQLGRPGLYRSFERFVAEAIGDRAV